MFLYKNIAGLILFSSILTASVKEVEVMSTFEKKKTTIFRISPFVLSINSRFREDFQAIPWWISAPWFLNNWQESFRIFYVTCTTFRHRFERLLVFVWATQRVKHACQWTKAIKCALFLSGLSFFLNIYKYTCCIFFHVSAFHQSYAFISTEIVDLQLQFTSL